MIGVVSAGVGNIVEDFFPREAVAVRDAEEAHGAEGAFGVDVEAFPFAAAHVEGKLARHGEGVADLGLAGAEFAEDLGHAAGFDAASEESVELFGAGRDGNELGAALVHFCGGGEAHGDELGGWRLGLVRYGCVQILTCPLLISWWPFALICLLSAPRLSAVWFVFSHCPIACASSSPTYKQPTRRY